MPEVDKQVVTSILLWVEGGSQYVLCGLRGRRAPAFKHLGRISYSYVSSLMRMVFTMWNGREGPEENITGSP